jgi:hypothetical protein
MSETLFAILTDTGIRQASQIQKQVHSEFSAGAPWFNKLNK